MKVRTNIHDTVTRDGTNVTGATKVLDDIIEVDAKRPPPKPIPVEAITPGITIWESSYVSFDNGSLQVGSPSPYVVIELLNLPAIVPLFENDVKIAYQRPVGEYFFTEQDARDYAVYQMIGSIKKNAELAKERIAALETYLRS